MNGKRVRALKLEARNLLGRSPAKVGSWVPKYFGGGMQQIKKDEFRVFKKAYMRTRVGQNAMNRPRPSSRLARRRAASLDRLSRSTPPA